MKTTAVRMKITKTSTSGDDKFTGMHPLEHGQRSSPTVEELGKHTENV